MHQRLSVCLAALLFCVVFSLFIFRGGGSSSEQLSGNVAMSQEQRVLVGGYSVSEELASAEFSELATFVMQEYARGSSSSQFTNVLSAEDISTSAIQTKVLEGSRQVVAGLNYRLTICILRNDVCIGALKDVTIYKPLPAMNAPPRVTSWGHYLPCTDEVLMNLLRMSEESEA